MNKKKAAEVAGISKVILYRNKGFYYALDDDTKLVFEEVLGIPFYYFTESQRDTVKMFLDQAGIKATLKGSRLMIRDTIQEALNDWTKLKDPIKRKFTVSEDLTHITFRHLGPTLKSVGVKAKAIEKCQSQIYPFVMRAWSELEAHYFRINVMSSSANVHVRDGKTLIEITYPMTFKLLEVPISDEGDDE